MSSLVGLLRRLELDAGVAALAVLMLLLAGAAEASSVGLLVPLLGALTGKVPADSLVIE